MKEHPALERFEEDDRRILEHANGMRRARRMRVFGRPLSKAAMKALSFTNHDLKEHLQVEDLTLISVMREHEADSLPEVIQEDENRRLQIIGAMEALRGAVEDDDHVAGALADLERSLRDYVDHQENVLLPWAMNHLGDDLLTEADSRLAEVYWKEDTQDEPAATARRATAEDAPEEAPAQHADAPAAR